MHEPAYVLLAAALASAGTTAVPTALPESPFVEPLQETAGTDALAQAFHMAQNAPIPSPKARSAAPQHAPAPQQQPEPPIGLEQALYLIRSTLLTLNDANRSGNYTVLRDLAAPGFQAKNTAADLSLIFNDLRRRHVDLFAVALMAPQLAAAPAIDDKGMLRLTGHFPTQPLQIRFDLLFQNLDNQWRLFGVSVQTPDVAPQANVPSAPQQRHP